MNDYWFLPVDKKEILIYELPLALGSGLKIEQQYGFSQNIGNKN